MPRSSVRRVVCGVGRVMATGVVEGVVDGVVGAAVDVIGEVVVVGT